MQLRMHALDRSIFIFMLLLGLVPKGNHKRGGRPIFTGVILRPSGRMKGGLPMVTYENLIQIGIFIVALVGLCYQIFKDKN